MFLGFIALLLGGFGSYLYINQDQNSEISSEIMEDTIEEALESAEKAGIKGKELTPYLLSKIKDLTGGESLETNRRLVFENARIGAGIAVAYAKL